MTGPYNPPVFRQAGGFHPSKRQAPVRNRDVRVRLILSLEDTLEELKKTDFKPFQVLSQSDIVPGLWGMVAHIVYSAIDPDTPSSVSPKIIQDIIREEIGFEGLLLSDDLDMKALETYGSIEERVLKTLEAGCDVALYCAGELGKMEKIANSVPKLTSKAQESLQKSLEFRTVSA